MFNDFQYLDLMRFEIIGAQAQDASLNFGIKNGPSISNRPLMVSLNASPKRGFNSPLLKDR